jgi:hypothetical protein
LGVQKAASVTPGDSQQAEIVSPAVFGLGHGQ